MEGAEQCYDSSIDETDTANERSQQINPVCTEEESNSNDENLNNSVAGNGDVNAEEGVDAPCNKQLSESEASTNGNAHGSNEDALERMDHFLGNTILYCDDVKEEAEEYESDNSDNDIEEGDDGCAAVSQKSYIDCGEFIKVELLEEVDDEILSQPLLFD